MAKTSADESEEGANSHRTYALAAYAGFVRQWERRLQPTKSNIIRKHETMAPRSAGETMIKRFDLRYWLDCQICWRIGHRSAGSRCSRCGAMALTPERGLRLFERWHAWNHKKNNVPF